MGHKIKWLYGIASLLIALFVGACGHPCGSWDPESLAVTPPAKSVYNVGESIELAGLVITASYGDGSTVVVAYPHRSLSFSGLDTVTATAGTKTVTVAYGGKIAKFKVTVNAVENLARVLESIAVSTPPSKTAYYVGDTLELAGLVVTATYDDTSTVVIAYPCEDFSFTDFDSSTDGEKTVTVTYGGKNADFTVSVSERPGDVTLDVEDIVVTDEGAGLAIFDIPPVVLSKTGAATEKTFTLDDPEYTNLVWSYGDNELANGNSVTLDAASFSTGNHTLTLEFTKNSKPWLASLNFTVED